MLYHQAMENQNNQIAKLIASMPLETRYRAPNFRGGQEVSKEEYHMLLNERLSNVGIMLDAKRHRITTEEKARKWVEFKKAVVSAKNMSDPYKKVDVVIDLEKSAGRFADSL